MASSFFTLTRAGLVVTAGIMASTACSPAPLAPSPAVAPPRQTTVASGYVSTGQPGAVRLTASIIEYPGPRGWVYAPQMRVTETSGVGGVVVTGARFGIPGFGKPTDCVTRMRVAPGTSLDLFPEIYGDYPLSFDKAGERVTGPVDVVLSFVDDSGRQDSITLSLLVTPGDLPTTYTGGSGASLSCGPFPVTTGLGGH